MVLGHQWILLFQAGIVFNSSKFSPSKSSRGWQFGNFVLIRQLLVASITWSYLLFPQTKLIFTLSSYSKQMMSEWSWLLQVPMQFLANPWSRKAAWWSPDVRCLQVFEDTFFIFFFLCFYKKSAYSKDFCHTKMKGPSSQGHSWNKTPEYFTLAEVGMPGCFVREWLEGRRIFFQICLIKMPLQFSLSFISIGFQRLSKQNYTGLYFKCTVKTW